MFEGHCAGVFEIDQGFEEFRDVNDSPADGATEETGNPQFTWSPYNDPDPDPQRYLQE